MTTIEEFKNIMQSMYDKGYVLISLHKIAKMETQPDGTVQMVQQPIYLPRGKSHLYFPKTMYAIMSI